MNIGLRGKTTVDDAFFYAPYIPLSMKMSALGLGYTKPKYTFSRAKWYEASLKISSTTAQIMEVHAWCSEQFGPVPKHEDAWCRWGQLGTKLKFRDEKDYILFVLRWS